MRRGWWKNLYVQVLVAIVAGVLLGHFAPELGAKMKPLGDGFIKLIKMIIGPVIFLTVVVGIAKMGDLKHVGRVGIKALIWFEVATTLALALGLIVVNLVQPGAGMNVSAAPNSSENSSTCSRLPSANAPTTVFGMMFSTNSTVDCDLAASA